MRKSKTAIFALLFFDRVQEMSLLLKEKKQKRSRMGFWVSCDTLQGTQFSKEDNYCLPTILMQTSDNSDLEFVQCGSATAGLNSCGPILPCIFFVGSCIKTLFSLKMRTHLRKKNRYNILTPAGRLSRGGLIQTLSSFLWVHRQLKWTTV